MTRCIISENFDKIQIKILRLYKIYHDPLSSVDKDRVLRLIHHFESELHKLDDMYFDLSGDIEKYVQFYDNRSLVLNDEEND